ncbi:MULTISPECIES: helix-turn-helix domain-containing protein [Brevibacillus]|uniref:Transposase and inactivated derivatives n=6 Tax=Brevibacillus TaxID=55080 RepID=A0A1I4EEC4_9BACL|nr:MULTISPECIES: helix-turn-helix domain-containing protein [Brevibacillus]MEC2133398.1 helix-turn-helix domain-containing protein [Brevibacillus centrosporus]MED4910587.1 helix-turn-helix domain-containing protein [Brevibacillus centrosporus]RNB63261.1 transposase [Brevibacillus centrosporus]SFL03330.1 Transposase and inactivated derivatives [Brevibacillus centrosporus]GED35071.1 transposase [Brevibacillus centrosporus]
MAKKNEYSGAEKLAILEELKTGGGTLVEVAHKYNLHKKTLRAWRHQYELYGMEGLEIRIKNNRYSPELKLQAVQDYLSGKYSQYELIDTYKIASRTQLRSWIAKYNSHSSFKSVNEGASAMTKGRSTTWQERIDIVLYCMAHKRNYGKTAAQFNVSYNQVYQWVKKYENGGQDALQDGRGRKKASEELTEAERHKLEMKKLEYENERLRAENAFLKKLKEIQRRRV